MTGVLHDDATFEAERRRLVGLAYRITGSRAEADDVVQDAWLRWQRADPDTVVRPAAWLTTTTSRLALDRLRSARHQRETYVGPWLPEPANPEPGPADRAELAETLTFGFLTLLERLGPVERVVFLLADVFAVPFDEIAQVVDKTPEACRQVASRARRRVREERPRFSPTDDEAWQVTAAFMEAAQAGDLDTLVALLADDALAITDGGADHHAARRPIVAERVPRFIANVTRRGVEPGDVFVPRPVNGQPGVVIVRAGEPVTAVGVSVDHGLVHRLWVIVNPEKLRTLDSAPVT
ncbi:MAG TPA: RNA polymerase sigma factor SigJ [Aquihabitans sp.]|jgi:RNA polymerase sigma-70 factor (ECF subfamily)|nr:RNA polymerase sigma factor SigJ [Aquihabitans sp.]